MGKTALVLGSSGGIGFEVCKKLILSGHTVIAQYQSNSQKVQDLYEYTERRDQLIPLQMDLTNSQQVDQVTSSLIQPDIFIHAGGHHYEGLFEETPDEEMEKLWKVHLYQPGRMLRRLIPGMRRKQGASIVFVTSIWGETGASYEVMYSAVKGAQISFVKALGKELAPNGIRVNAVAPGAVSTAMTAHYDEDVKAGIEDEIPAGRFARPEEIADAVVFLTGEQSTYIHAQVLSVNGGWYS
ncbi:elongation factor P 5-aminopentanone reductase [Jeotgalibacillus haloalkalitolerans]|uniref:SDR family oxidoreductase n=1 Tax=Jeotgalibacillus haloalkalitolerans TaxID=3104292 RepID=A0ABU5KKJ5_9BACL|nr:SDR family oxidoreductase [Jeotgalibacillus sp. HH7-29]MDZ5711785.1 SDR family oxidoreductase [Jeotgalibacillus sp. HH7-29]